MIITKIIGQCICTIEGTPQEIAEYERHLNMKDNVNMYSKPKTVTIHKTKAREIYRLCERHDTVELIVE